LSSDLSVLNFNDLPVPSDINSRFNTYLFRHCVPPNTTKTITIIGQYKQQWLEWFNNPPTSWILEEPGAAIEFN
jgi:hypothetical protein